MRISHRESLSEKGFGLFTATAAFTKRRLKERCEDAPSARRGRIVSQQFSLFSQISCFEQLTSIKCWKHSFVFFFQGQQKCYETGGGLFCATRTECDVFLRWKIPLIHHQTNGKTFEFAFLCILLKTLSFFSQGFCHFPLA